MKKSRRLAGFIHLVAVRGYLPFFMFLYRRCAKNRLTMYPAIPTPRKTIAPVVLSSAMGVVVHSRVEPMISAMFFDVLQRNREKRNTEPQKMEKILNFNIKQQNVEKNPADKWAGFFVLRCRETCHGASL